jgi:hypothetical protein
MLECILSHKKCLQASSMSVVGSKGRYLETKTLESSKFQGQRLLAAKFNGYKLQVPEACGGQAASLPGLWQEYSLELNWLHFSC